MKRRSRSIRQLIATAARITTMTLILLGMGLLPVAAHGAACVGDCTSDGEVTVDELLIGVNIALGNQPLENCPVFDVDGSGEVEVNELIIAVNNLLNGCPAEPTETPTSVEPVATETPTSVEATPTETSTATAPTETPTQAGLPPTETQTQGPASETPTAVPPTETAAVPSPTPTATATPIPAATATATMVAASPGAPIALGVSVAVDTMSFIPSVVSAIVQGAKGGGGAAAALDTGPLGGGAGMCPLGGMATRSGSFPPILSPLSFTLTGCQVATADGSVTFDGTGMLTLSTFSINIQAVFKDSGGTETLRVTAMFMGTQTLSLNIGSSCLINGITFIVTSGSLTAMQSGSQVGINFQNTTLAITNIHFNTSCVPDKYLMTLNGPAALTTSVGQPISVTFNSLTMDVDDSGNPTTFNLGGGMTSACFGGAVMVSSNPLLAVKGGDLCPTAGVITATFTGGSAKITYKTDGSVEVDANGDGTTDETAPNCLDPRLAMCLA